MAPDPSRDDIARRVAYNLRKAREDQDLTQVELSELTGIAQQQISRWESGPSMPRLDFLITLAHALQMNVPDFYEPIPAGRSNGDEHPPVAA